MAPIPIFVEHPRWEFANRFESASSNASMRMCSAYPNSSVDVCCSVCAERIQKATTPPYIANSIFTNQGESKYEVQLDDAIVDSIVSRCFEPTESATVHSSKQVASDSKQVYQSQHRINTFHTHQTSQNNNFSRLSPFSSTDSTTSIENVKMEHLLVEEYTNCSQESKKMEIDCESSQHEYNESRRINQDTAVRSSGRIRKRGKRARARPWSPEEQKRFEESLDLHGRNWELCADYIGTRRAPLVRSHAQKHLIKLWKLGKPLPKKLAETGSGYTLSGKPLLADSASAKSYLIKLPCPPPSEDYQKNMYYHHYNKQT